MISLLLSQKRHGTICQQYHSIYIILPVFLEEAILKCFFYRPNRGQCCYITYIVIYIGRNDTRLHNVVGGFALRRKLHRFDLWKISVPPASVTSPNQNELLLDLSPFSDYDIEICSKMFFSPYNRWLSPGLLGWGKNASLELCNCY